MKKISRRSFVKAAGTVLALTALTACGGSAGSTAASGSTASSAASGSAAASSEALSADVQAIVDRGVLKVGVKNAVKGFSFQDTLTGEYTGLEDSLAEMIAEHLGVDVEFTTVTAATRGELLDSGDIDCVLATFTITEERRKNIGFTSAYMENHQIIVVPAASTIKTKAELAGKVIGIQDGSSAVDAVQKDPVAASFKELKKFGDNVTALMDLTTGRLDAVVLDEVVGRYYTAKKPNDYAVLDDHFGTEEYGVGTRKDDTALLAKLQQAMDEMKADGSAARISTDWFGKNIIK